MRDVLLLPANDADPGHMQALENILPSLGLNIVRWSPSLTEHDYDYSLLIPGLKNEDMMYDIWIDGDVTVEEKGTVSESDDLYLGRGLFTHIENAKKPAYILCGTNSPTDYDPDYMNNKDDMGPVFFQVTRKDLTLLGRNQTTTYGCIENDKIHGRELCLINHIIDKYPTATFTASKPDKDEVYTLSTNLLLLRRGRM